MPAYEFKDFLQCCADRTVFVWEPALKTAASDFSLHGQDRVQEFIAGDGLESLGFDDSQAFREWKGPAPQPTVDSYTFSTGKKDGYLAFFRSPLTGIFNLKSFKRNVEPVPHNFIFQKLLKPQQSRLEQKKSEGPEE